MSGILYTKKQQGGIVYQQPDMTISTATSSVKPVGDVSFLSQQNQQPVQNTSQYKRVGIKGQKDYINVQDLQNNPAYHPGRKNPIDTTNYTEEDYIRDANQRLQKQYTPDWRYVRKGDRLYMEQLQPVS